MNLIMIADKKESDGILLPFKQNADGQVHSDFP